MAPRRPQGKRATPQQRMADALAELICEPASGRKSAGTDLLVIADFDVIKQQLDNPRLADGSPIPIVELHRLALEANLLPSIFDTKAQDMWLGRRQRTASEAQRVALIARDQHCIGCGANPLWCRAHHIMSGGQRRGQPTSKTSRWYATTATTRSTTTAGQVYPTSPKPGNTSSNPRPIRRVSPAEQPPNSGADTTQPTSSGECSAHDPCRHNPRADYPGMCARLTRRERSRRPIFPG